MDFSPTGSILILYLQAILAMLPKTGMSTMTLKIKDKEFVPYIKAEEIQAKIKELASRIDTDYQGREPLLVGVLNGSFMFAADLMKHITIPCRISFIKMSSYYEMESSGNVKALIGLNENIFKKDVIIVEDIVDTGLTVRKVLEEFQALGAHSVEVMSLLHKPEVSKSAIDIKYCGFEIPQRFVVGFGLDYDGLGRNLEDIYQLAGE
jgi:hypoxanthine phosphoribosyltransferase